MFGSLDIRKSAKPGDCGPGTDEVDWYDQVFDRGMAEKKAENVEHVVTVVSEGEGVDYGVKSNDKQHNGHDWNSDR